MALIEIQRECKECEKTREALKGLSREVEAIRLDYLNLYEKVRTNLAKLAKRTDAANAAGGDGDDSGTDVLARARASLIERKLGRNHGVR